MGDRSLIVVSNEQNTNLIVMYGHWSGSDNLTAVHNVMADTGRVGDHYLVAELFHEFSVVLGGYAGIGSNGFGIWADRTETFSEIQVSIPVMAKVSATTKTIAQSQMSCMEVASNARKTIPLSNSLFRGNG
jgi:hypothetical protein